jgi:hypothetical protein
LSETHESHGSFTQSEPDPTTRCSLAGAISGRCPQSLGTALHRIGYKAGSIHYLRRKLERNNMAFVGMEDGARREI